MHSTVTRKYFDRKKFSICRGKMEANKFRGEKFSIPAQCKVEEVIT